MNAKTFSEFCKHFNTTVPDVVTIGKKYFYDPKHLHKQGYDATSVGIYLGEEKKWFRPTSALVDLMKANSITVNDEAAWMFICGKDILMEGVIEDCPEGLAFVKDTDGNTLGYGTVVTELNPEEEHRVFLKNRLDKGEYLRREKH